MCFSRLGLSISLPTAVVYGGLQSGLAMVWHSCSSNGSRDSFCVIYQAELAVKAMKEKEAIYLSIAAISLQLSMRKRER